MQSIGHFLLHVLASTMGILVGSWLVDIWQKMIRAYRWKRRNGK